LTYLRLFVIIWWLFDDYLWLFELPNRDVRPYSGVCDYLMIICNYWSYLITNNYQIMLSLFDDYFIIIFTQIIPIIQTIKAKYEYLVPFWQIIFTSQQSLFDDYLMIIWWLFDNDYHNICIMWIIWFTEKLHPYRNSPLFAFTRLCCLKISVVRFARLAKVTSDLLDSSLQGVP